MDAKPDVPAGMAAQESSTEAEEPAVLGPAAPQWVPDWFEAQAARMPDAVAVIFGGESLSYRGLGEKANRWARFLQGRGAGPGTVVGLCAGRSLEGLAVLLGTLQAGAACAPLDPGQPVRRMRRMLDRLAAGVVILEDAGLAAGRGEGGEVWSLAEASRCAARESPLRPVRVLRGEDPAYVLFTSGSTGEPAGVEMPHRALANLIAWQAGHSVLSPGGRTLQFAAHGFDVAMQEMFGAWCGGGTLVMIDAEARREPDALLGFLARERIERVFLPPAMLQELARVAEDVGRLPGSLREICAAGDTLRITPAVRGFLRRLPGCVLENHYGPTETHVVTCNRLTGDPGDWPEFPEIGHPLPGVELAILDEAGSPVADEAEGEIILGGVCLARGYRNDPARTAERFGDVAFGGGRVMRGYRTGDRGLRGPDGAVSFRGRRDGQVKIRGFRVELGEVEAVLARHPGVRACAVVCCRRGEDAELTAFWTAEDTGSAGPAEGELREQLRAELPAPMLPAAYRRLETLPLSPNGKVDRRALEELGAASAQQQAQAMALAPGESWSETERRVAAIWAEVLGTGRVGRCEDFFALGGHSLSVTRVLGRIAGETGVELSHRAMFDGPTVEALARRIDAARCGRSSAGADARGSPGALDAPLSEAQMAMWIAVQRAPLLPVYQEPFTVFIPEAVDAAAVEEALRALIARHSALRTGFPEGGEEPRQRVQASAAFQLEVIDLRDLPGPERESRAAFLAAAQARRIFDLERPPLLRATLVRLGEAESRLELVLHHLIADAFAVYHILIPEFREIYEARLRGRAPDLEPVRLEFWQWAAEARGRGAEADLEFWRESLRGAPFLDLSVPGKRPADRTFRGAHLRFSFPAELTERLREAGRRRGATLFMTLLAAFKAFLWRVTGCEDIVIGTVESGRDRPESEGVFGCCLNLLALRTEVHGALRFEELLGRVRETVLEAQDHRRMPVMGLTEESGLPAGRGGSPLYQVAFVMEPALPRQEGGWEVSQIEVQTGAAKFDLTVELEERGGGVIGRVEYADDLFEEASIRRMIREWTELVVEAAGRPERSLDSLTPGAGGWRREPPEGVRSGAAIPVGLGSLASGFEEWAAQTPDAPAVSFAGSAVSYQELNRMANRLARELRRLGAGPGTRVALCLERSPLAVVGILGVLKAGAAYAPIDPAEAPERMAFVLRDVGPVAVVTQAEAGKKLPAGTAPLLWLEEIVARASPADDSDPPAAAQREDLAYVIYTSGSSGTPKGVLVTHHNVLRLFSATDPWFGFSSRDVWTLFHSCAFDFSVWEMWGALLYGGRLVIVPRWMSRSPGEFLDLLAMERVTVLNQTPSAFRELMHEEARGEGLRLCLRWVIFGGEALDFASLAPWFARHGDERPRLVNMYGITETTVHTTYRPLTSADAAGCASLIGQPIPDLQLHLLDEQGRPVATGETGEIYVGGEGVARGYLNRPGLTAERFLPDSFSGRQGGLLYRSGDLARRTEEGDVEYLGRADQQVKVRGFRIELGEIETALCRHPEILGAAVAATEEKGGGIRLVAYVTTRTGEAGGEAELRAFLRDRLPDHMLPGRYVTLERLPLTANGKLDRRSLPAVEAGAPVARAREAGAPAREQLEETIAAVWRELLQREDLEWDDNFFDLGGHSLMAVRIAARLRQALSRDVRIRWLFEEPTVAGLARLLRRELGAAAGDAGQEAGVVLE